MTPEVPTIHWPLAAAGFTTVYKTLPEDFRVDEVPAYDPSGEGTFVYLHIEKRDVSSGFLLKTLAERLGVNQNALGMAGRKDRRAVTRQWLSVLAKDLPDGVSDDLAASIDGKVGDEGWVRLIDQSRHTNKLRTGHVRANRFTIRLRGPDVGTDTVRDAIATRLETAAQRGVPNLFGPQRFGGGDTVQLGLAALGGRRIKQKRRLKLAISAVQSLVFNRWLALRAEAGTLETALAGDVLKKRDSGGLFVCEDAATDTGRIRAGELVLTGPLPGNKMRNATGDAAHWEEEALASLELGESPFKQLGKLAPGTRRPALLFPAEVGVEDVSEDAGEPALDLSFSLPKGAYATVLLQAVAGATQAPHHP